jgi:hypothetical protein
LNNLKKNLEKKYNEMKLHIDLSPQGSLYYQAKKSWYDRFNENQKTNENSLNEK